MCELLTFVVEIGASHLDANIDEIVEAFGSAYMKGDVRGTGVFAKLRQPQFKSAGGSNIENLALQNIQARTRMAFGYMLSQLLPWSVERRQGLLVLASANVDEALRGYLTKYDASSADLNPIGAVSKRDLASFLDWAAVALSYTTLLRIRRAPPTAELEPRSDKYGTLVADVDVCVYCRVISRV
jgi:NAD+ synthase (glutamine-hydrolysing)